MHWRILTGIVLSLTATASGAALLGRAPLTPGGTDYQAYYDDSLNITWLANANYAQTSGFDSDGSITWFQAGTWLSSLNTNSYLGMSAWRLPKISDNGQWVNMAADEMANLFYMTLGNTGYYSPLGPETCGDNVGFSCLTNSGPFSNFQPNYYWYSNEYSDVPGEAWHFNFYNGVQSVAPRSNTAFAWAVHDGDPFAVVPVPAAVWLLCSALASFPFIRRQARKL